jgi:hypothetical protein
MLNMDLSSTDTDPTEETNNYTQLETQYTSGSSVEIPDAILSDPNLGGPNLGVLAEELFGYELDQINDQFTIDWVYDKTEKYTGEKHNSVGQTVPELFDPTKESQRISRNQTVPQNVTIYIGANIETTEELFLTMAHEIAYAYFIINGFFHELAGIEDYTGYLGDISEFYAYDFSAKLEENLGYSSTKHRTQRKIYEDILKGFGYEYY